MTMQPIPLSSRSPYAFLLAVLLAGVTAAQTVTLKSSLLVSGLSRPVFVVSPPADTQRLFIVEQAGVIKIFENGAILGAPFLNIDPIVGGGATEESGLLGLAFHPNYASNRKFYVCYTDNTGASVVREYLADAANPDLADPTSFTTIVPPIPHPADHNGGCLEFGRDGKLYLSLGDGDDGAHGQLLTTYLGKLLRIDVDNPPTFVPAGNPFGASSFPLIWSYGWRNPWRFSFDRQTGDFYGADVGNSSWEEVDFQPAGSPGGENYGWRCMEGNHCTGLSGCTCGSGSLSNPIVEYSHGNGCAVIGGYVYRGTAILGFQGNYIYGDFCNGRIWSFTYDGSSVSNFVERTSELDPPGPATLAGITSFGQDASGELYICNIGGQIYRIESVCPNPVSFCVTTPNSAGAGARMRYAGTGSIPQNDLVLRCSGCPAHVSGFFFYGQGQTQVPLGNGYRCVPSPILRLPAVQTNSLGNAAYSFDVNAPPHAVTAGSVWSFQFWFRDVPGGGALYDLSDGLSVTFCAY
jgi:glucose/arabinose dehydrogenase